MSMTRTVGEILKDLRYAINPFDIEEKEEKIVEITDINKLIHDFSIQCDHASYQEIAEGLELISLLVSIKKPHHIDFAAIEKLYSIFDNDHYSPQNKKKADWAYKRLQASKKQMTPQLNSNVPEIKPFEVKEEEIETVLNTIFRSNILSFEKLYELPPFNQHESYCNKENVIKWLLAWLNNSTKQFSYILNIYNKVSAFLPEIFEHFTAKEALSLLDLLIQLKCKGLVSSLTPIINLIKYIDSFAEGSDPIYAKSILSSYVKLNEVSAIDANIVNRAFNYLHKMHDVLTLDFLSSLLFAATELSFFDKLILTDANINKFQDLLDYSYTKIPLIDKPTQIRNILLCPVKLMQKSGKHININSTRIELLFNKLHEIAHKANSQDISGCLLALSKLIEMGALKIELPRLKIDNLLTSFLILPTKSSEEICNLLSAMMMFANFNPFLINSLFNQLLTHPHSSDAQKSKAVWTLIQLYDKNKMGDFRIEQLKTIFFQLSETHRKSDSNALHAEEWFLQYQLKYNIHSKNKVDPLFAHRTPPEKRTPKAQNAVTPSMRIVHST